MPRGWAGCSRSELPVICPAEATGGSAVLHSEWLIWVTLQGEVSWISTHSVNTLPPHKPRLQEAPGAPWRASSRPGAGSQDLQAEIPTISITCERRAQRKAQGIVPGAFWNPELSSWEILSQVSSAHGPRNQLSWWECTQVVQWPKQGEGVKELRKGDVAMRVLQGGDVSRGGGHGQVWAELWGGAVFKEEQTPRLWTPWIGPSWG